MGDSPLDHRHDDHDFSILDEYGVPDNKEVDPILQISERYLKQLEEGRRIQSRTVDNYLRINFDPPVDDRVTQRQRPQ